MAELLVNVPQMQRDLQCAREENAYLRTLLKQLNVSDLSQAPLSLPYYKTDDSSVNDTDDIEFNHTLARRQARLDLDNDSRETLTTGLELKTANDRVSMLEWQLLNAEETICHLKAEKLAALRDIERLSSATMDTERQASSIKNDSEEQCTLVLELKTRLAEDKQVYALEQEQQMAVIRDQESELKTLRRQLDDTMKQLKELQQRHMDLLELDEEATMEQQRVLISDGNRFSVSGEESDEDDETMVVKQRNDCNPGRARASASADAVNSKWHEELVHHPTPHFDMQSPEVAYILRAWTNNIKKMRYLRRWLVQVVATKGPLPDDFPMAVELPRLPPEVRDGFLTLILPLLRKQTEREILAHSRRHNDGIHTDLRFRAVPRQ
ncbi:unnamed protein product [Peronospora farinosa]|uniref:Uncharacterized protein n=1 Tax=Peronospora farinosa TaxID=134698 RepID=A0AAV0SRN4_9STRA|nr:unnamed protein product [Peronospora farinosa]CAI5706117.1 unnamed protein product [Peronospora farinosa]